MGWRDLDARITRVSARLERASAAHPIRYAVVWGISFGALWFLLHYVLLVAAGRSRSLGFVLIGSLFLGTMHGVFLGWLLPKRAREQGEDD